jgi:hypothetical protein
MKPFDWRAALKEADRILSEPKAKPWINRPERDCLALFRFVLPLELCKPFNRVGRAGSASAGWALGKMKEDAANLMLAQLEWKKPNRPLLGRPRVLCCRFSSAPVDRDSGWTKNPVDRLRANVTNGLGIIRDDSEEAIDLQAWWEPTAPKCGFVLVEVRLSYD